MSESLEFWAKTANRYPLLPVEETLRLGRMIQSSEPGSPKHAKAVNKLALHNLRLALKWTRSYIQSSTTLTYGGVKTVDLLQEAFIGLRKAAEKFDPTRGYAFSTYARAWVYRSISLYHSDTRSDIRVPASSASEIFYYRKHGKPRDFKVEWVKECARSADQAYGMTSFDAIQSRSTENGAADSNGNGSFIDSIAQSQSLTYSTQEQQTFNYDTCREIMDSLNVDKLVQDVIMCYSKVGNMETALGKYKVQYKKGFRKKVRDEIQRIKDTTHAPVH